MKILYLHNITIATNGLLLNDYYIEQLKIYNKLRIQISLDSSEALKHDYYRGVGTFERTVKIIEELVKNGFFTTTRMTISNINISEMENFVKLGHSLGTKFVSMNKYIPDRNNKSNYLKALTKEQHDQYLSEIQRLKVLYGEDFVLTEDPCFNKFYAEQIKQEYSKELSEKFIIGGCSAGITNLSITTKGEVYPCTLLNMSIGTLRKDRLKELWEGDSLILMNLRNRNLKGKCAECENLFFCSGCRAAANKIIGHYLNEDPFCNYNSK